MKMQRIKLSTVLIAILALTLPCRATEDCLTWMELATGDAPPIDQDHQMAYDKNRGITVYITDGLLQQPETWEFDGDVWYEPPVTFTPSVDTAETYSAMTYDSARGVCVLVVPGTVYEWDGQVWHERGDTPHPLMIEFAMAYDSQREVTVLLGAPLGATVEAIETWEWDGKAWTERFPDQSPPYRIGHGLAYDEARGVTVMFGGRGIDGAFHNDIWEYDGQTWILNEPEPNDVLPTPERFGFQWTYDSTKHVMALSGGIHPDESTIQYDDWWEWDGTYWIRRQPQNAPTAAFHRVVYESARDQYLMRDDTQAGTFALRSDSEAPEIVSQPANVGVTEGQPAQFAVDVESEFELLYQWRHNGAEIHGATLQAYSIASATDGDQGVYDCVVRIGSFGPFECGMVTSIGATLTVTTACPADVDGDGVMGPGDLALVLGLWGSCPR